MLEPVFPETTGPARLTGFELCPSSSLLTCPMVSSATHVKAQAGPEGTTHIWRNTKLGIWCKSKMLILAALLC